MPPIHNIIKAIFLTLLLSNAAYGFTIKDKDICDLDEAQIEYFEDESKKKGINDLISVNSTFEFLPLGENNKNIGFSKSAYWLKFSINNESDINKVFFFTIAYPLLNDLKYYEVNGNEILDSIQTGENYIHSSRPIKNRDFIFNLFVPSNEERTFVFRLYNDGETLRLPLKLMDSNSKEQYDDSADIFLLVIFFGYISFAFILNLLLFIEMREKVYLFLSIFTISLTLFLLTINGVAFEYFWPNSPYFSNRAMVFFSATATIFILLFSIDFLKLKGLKKTIANCLIALSGSMLIWGLLPSPIYQSSVLVGNIFIFICIGFVLVVSFYRYLDNKSKHSLLFLMSLALLLSGGIIYILRNLGIIPNTHFTQKAIEIGFALQVTLLSFATIVKFKRAMNKTKVFLEEMVEKRTNLIYNKNKLLQDKNEQIESQFNEIQQSIHYAKRIQEAILPHSKKFSALFEDHMILYKPKDIVSGDFYWVVAYKNNKTYIAAADCTGHGVPGAFLSMLGMSFLNQIVTANKDIKPNEVLNKLRVLFADTLSNNSTDSISNRDSMDISICLFDHAKKEMEYAGAYNSILIIRDEKLIELKVDRFSLDNDMSSENKDFENFECKLQTNDKIYMFSDGYHDQFGGENNKRLSKKQFKKILLETSNLPLSEQKTVLNNKIIEWQDDRVQVDDILILGLLV